MIAPFILGSKEEIPHAKIIAEVLDDYGVPYKFYIASANKAPETTLEIIERYNEMKESVVFVTIASQSNALSGLVAGNTHFPVISCPPFEDKADYLTNIHSSVQMPNETPVLTVVNPKNAGQAIVRMIGLNDKDLMKKVKNHIKVVKRSFSPNPVNLD